MLYNESIIALIKEAEVLKSQGRNAEAIEVLQSILITEPSV